MDVTALPKLSADCHVEEPHDLWYDRLPDSLRDFAPRRIHRDDDGSWSLVVDGSAIGWMTGVGKSVDIETLREMERQRIAAVSVEQRLDMLRTDNIRGEVIYPTIGLYIWSMEHGDAGEACCRVYNDWIVEQLGGHPRIKLAGLLPTWNVDHTIAEVERLAADPSFACLMLPLVGTPEWNMPQWEPLWAALGAAGKPVVMHQGTGHDMLHYRGWGSPTANVLATQSMAPRAAGLLACSGVFARHPDLHVVMVEVNAGWIAWAMSTLDEYYEAHRHWAKPKLDEMPSHYLRRQLHATFQDDAVGVRNTFFTGTDVLLWGNDYPHAEGIYPNSDKVLKRLLADVDETSARSIVGESTKRIFGFSDEVFDTAP